MKVLVCENNSCRTSSPFMVTDCLGNLFTGIALQTAGLRKSPKRNKSPPIRPKVVWRNYSEQMTEKRSSFKTCTKSPKKDTLSI